MELSVSELSQLVTPPRMTSPTSAAHHRDHGARIVILQRGWVVVGNVSQDGSLFTITQCRVIRKWGTTAGLGQIAINGPTPDTVLDRAGDVTFHELTAVAQINCDADKWKVVLS